jgi:hypothetical protein
MVIIGGRRPRIRTSDRIADSARETKGEGLIMGTGAQG